MVDIPETGCAFIEGQRPRGAGFFLEPKSPASPLVRGGPPLVWGATARMVVAAEDVEDIDEVDDIEEEELARCGIFRGINMRVTSSALIEFKPPWPPLPAFHPSRGWKLGGEATAVIRSAEYLIEVLDAMSKPC